MIGDQEVGPRSLAYKRKCRLRRIGFPHSVAVVGQHVGCADPHDLLVVYEHHETALAVDCDPLGRSIANVQRRLAHRQPQFHIRAESLSTLHGNSAAKLRRKTMQGLELGS